MHLIPDSSSDPNFFPSLYTIAQLCAGMLCMAAIFIRRHRWHGMKWPGVNPWKTGWLDMNILFWLLFAWALLAGSIGAKIMPMPENPTVNQLSWRSVLDGTLLQVGMLAILFGVWMMQPFERRTQLCTRHVGIKATLLLALLYFLAFVPIRFGVEILWDGILRHLNALGLHISLQEQEMVGLIDGTSSPAALIALLILAVVIAPIVEEMVFRAGLYRFLKGQIPRNTAIIASAGLFALLHMNLLVFPTLMLFGMALCLAYEASGNIKVPILMHAFFNLNAFLLIGLQGLGN